MKSASHSTQWHQYAGFSLFFDYEQHDGAPRTRQTRVYHEESGEEVQFRGDSPRPWIDWILHRTYQSAQVETEKDLLGVCSSYQGVAANASSLTILGVEVEEHTQHDAGGKKLIADIRSRLSGSHPEEDAAASAPCQILILAVDSQRGQTRLIATQKSLFYLDNTVNIHRLEFPVPDLGRYELQAIMFVQVQAELIARHLGPIVTILP